MKREVDYGRRAVVLAGMSFVLSACVQQDLLNIAQQRFSVRNPGRRITEVPPPPTPTPELPKFQAGEIVNRGNPRENIVYLTVDDCWDPNRVADALRIAKIAGVGLTFFPAGQAVQRNPDLYRTMLADGHSIQNHTFTHPDLTKLPDDGIRREIEFQNDALRRAVGESYTQHYLRPPYGAYDPRVVRIAQEYGLKVAMWTADSEGYTFSQTASPGTVEKVVANALRIVPNSPRDSLRGRIILQHAVLNDMGALPNIIQRMKINEMIPLTMPQGIK